MDIEGIDALIEAIKNFKGGVISISHDERFITNTSNQVRLRRDSLYPSTFNSISNLVKKKTVADMELLALGLRRRQGNQVYGRCGGVQEDCDARVASQVEALILGLQN